MKKIKIKTATLPTALPAKFYLAAAAIVLALLATPHIGHAQGLVRGAQEGSREGNRIAGPAIAAAAITIATIDSTATGRFFCDAIPGRREAANPESRDSPMCNCTSEVRLFDAPRNDASSQFFSR